jgi:hypothetical protein
MTALARNGSITKTPSLNGMKCKAAPVAPPDKLAGALSYRS